ncbi:MAG: hypothetical protein KatS3mg008_0548 [Acidimicrobiales bacterium]|nr:MAG: hypothetical protein KatS3mg008_0548 [Acidimicrobiales bacterium]
MGSNASTLVARSSIPVWRIMLAGCLALAGQVATSPSHAAAEEPPPARTFGAQPLADVRAAAAEFASCGLGADELAAMVLAPTFPETGAPSTQAPSPMTLSRWDTNSTLYPFSDPSSPYVGVFWHPGVGAWQFDSAGGWGLTAAERMDTWVAARTAAAEIVRRWCASPDRSYAWAPWHGCRNGKCEAIFAEIYKDGRLTGVAEDPAVERSGGTVQRTCDFDDRWVVPCWYVDPAAAQGYRGFVSPTFGPSPISKPFYVFSFGGYEYRHWLREDTGLTEDVGAARELRTNARVGLGWTTTRRFCDQTARRGRCDQRIFVDVPKFYTFAAEVAWAVSRDVARGYGDGTFRPTEGVKRKEAVAFLYRLAGSPKGPFPDPGFSDVGPAHPFRTEISWAASRGIVRGYEDGSFRPDHVVKRQEAVAFLYRLAGSPKGPFPDPGFSDVGPAHPFRTEISWATSEGIVAGFSDGTFRPSGSVLRQEQVAFLFRYSN